MEMIYPINEAGIAPYIGRPVCAATHDGSSFFGTLAGMKDGKLFLNLFTQGDGTVTANLKKETMPKQSRVKRVKSKAKQAKTAASFKGAFALPLASLAFLSALPSEGSPMFY